MKVIFLGTPDFAVPALKAINESTSHEVVALVCQEDKPSGRGQTFKAPPTKEYAIKHNIQVFQFTKIKTEGYDILKRLNADIMVCVAYGQMISQEIIDICPHGIINIHGSLLPKYRGAAPIQWSVINGEKLTGNTIMQMAFKMDAGDILFQQTTKIGDTETAGELFSRLAEMGGKMIVPALDKIEKGEITPIKQNEDEATYCKMLSKEMSQIDFAKTPSEIVNFVRGLNPWPVARLTIANNTFKIYSASVSDFTSNDAQIGEILCADSKNGLVVKCQSGSVKIGEMQAENGKRMNSTDYLNGKKLKIGEVVKK